MFDIGIGEVFVLLVVALLVFGPDRLPDMARQAAGFVRDLRTMVANARKDLSGTVGDLGIDKEDLKTLSDLRNPKSFVRQKVLDGMDLGLDGDDDSPSRHTNGNGRPSARSAATGGDRTGESVDVPPASADVPPEPEEDMPPPPMEDTPAGPPAQPAASEPARDAAASEPVGDGAAPEPTGDAASDPEPTPVPADAARSPRFDPDAT
ncbi:twin-arginine translocase TatA/TatE family subunit [Jiangella sp. DSM 45060]|uniref:twin-arginine translocase TatA/TatE family subunit n=1 Tax=Jiangella sp. DSM 45060 TaxID=1798224 RepID=UPI00087D75B4|nr:twin-arginine translocase TatA/TatE family subunit [Jiangella sp. DSM 45060]SDT53767.1 mttA/Hcf106 family protein [Jiangella sp. DSM 45060]